jgi:hypothetical protein
LTGCGTPDFQAMSHGSGLVLEPLFRGPPLQVMGHCLSSLPARFNHVSLHRTNRMILKFILLIPVDKELFSIKNKITWCNLIRPFLEEELTP